MISKNSLDLQLKENLRTGGTEIADVQWVQLVLVEFVGTAVHYRLPVGAWVAGGGVVVVGRIDLGVQGTAFVGGVAFFETGVEEGEATVAAVGA